MKKYILICITLIVMSFALISCNEAEDVSRNISNDADNFKIVRQLTVINCLQGDILFQMTGKMSITADPADGQLEIIVKNENGSYTKHFVGLSDNVTYVVEDLNDNNYNNGRYTLYYNPKMWLPAGIDYSGDN